MHAAHGVRDLLEDAEAEEPRTDSGRPLSLISSSRRISGGAIRKDEHGAEGSQTAVRRWAGPFSGEPCFPLVQERAVGVQWELPGAVARTDQSHAFGFFLSPAPLTGILSGRESFMRSFRPPWGGSPGHAVGGRLLDPAALPALLHASHLLGLVLGSALGRLRESGSTAARLFERAEESCSGAMGIARLQRLAGATAPCQPPDPPKRRASSTISRSRRECGPHHSGFSVQELGKPPMK
jgi:hypothetical protein